MVNVAKHYCWNVTIILLFKNVPMPIRKEIFYLVKDGKNGKICFLIVLCWVKLKTKVLPKYGIHPLIPTLNRSLILVTPQSSSFTLHKKHSKKFRNVFKRHLTSSNIHYFLKEGYYTYYYKWEGLYM
jgi:hypothetical protein